MMFRVFGNVEDGVAMPAEPVSNGEVTMDYNQPPPSDDGSVDASGGSEIPQDLVL